MAPRFSPSHRSAHFFGLFPARFWSSFIGLEVWNEEEYLNTLSCVSCIATVSNNSYSLHSATILTHTIACSHTAVSRKVVLQKRKSERDNVESYQLWVTMVFYLIDGSPKYLGFREGSSTNTCIHTFSGALSF